VPDILVADGGMPGERFTPAQHTGHRSVTGSAALPPILFRAMAYADLHFHLLPGVDDGPADMAASLDLARAAVAEGTRTVVVTPHVRADIGITDAVEIHARVLELRSALEAARIPLELRCGGELYHDTVGGMRQSELELLAQGPSGARWVLVETPFHGIADDTLDVGDDERVRQLLRQLHEHVEASVEEQAIDVLVGIAAEQPARNGADAFEQEVRRRHPRLRLAAGALGETEVERPLPLHPVIDAQFVSGMRHDDRACAHGEFPLIEVQSG